MVPNTLCHRPRHKTYLQCRLLPVGTDISKVVVSITSDGIGVFIVAEDKDSLWNETDSLNFEKPIQFKVMAMSGVYGPIYKAEINVHKQVPDSLQWSHRGSSFDNTIQAQKQSH